MNDDRCKEGSRARKHFFQLTGHKECFKIGKRSGTILKKSTGNEEECLRNLMNDELSSFVPKIFGLIESEGIVYLEIEDLLAKFDIASVMDVKMGCRTYREEELDYTAAKLRPDMFKKMVEVDKDEPTEEEKKTKAITKPRYMIWRETVSSTASLSFRIEGMRLSDGSVDTDFKTMKDEEQIMDAFIRYAKSNQLRLKYLQRLYDLRKALELSEFFSTHEMIGSSLLFVHSDDDACIWLIDFAKTHLLPEEMKVTHRRKWELGNHEDGFLTGIDNLIRIFQKILTKTKDQIPIESSNQQQQQIVTQEKTKNHNPTSNPHVKLRGSKVCLKGTTRFMPELRT